MALSFTTKQHDTRPTRTIYLTETDPASPATTRAVDLTNATSAKLNAKSGNDTWSSVLAIANPKTLGQLVYTPVAGDTDTAGDYQAEVEVTWSDGGIETYPNDTYFTIHIVSDLG